MEDEIIKASIKDVSKINVLVNSAYRGESAKLGWTSESDILDGTRIDEEEIISLIKQPDTTILTYVRNSDIIGCVLLQKENESLYLGMLTVDPVLQSSGVGKKLLSASEKYARSIDCQKIKMAVISVRNELIAFYERAGYKDTGERKPFPEEDLKFGLPKFPLEFIVMSKSLID